MTDLRGSGADLSPDEADRVIARFVRNVAAARRQGAAGSEQGPAEAERVSPSNRPKRKSNDSTARISRPQEPGESPDVAGAEEDYSEASMSEEERRKLIVELAALYRHGHIGDVVDEVETARSKHPHDVELLGALSDFFLEREDTPRAVELLFAMVDAHFERRDPDAARRCLERVEHIDPTNRRLKSFAKLLRPDGDGASRRPAGGNDG